MITHYDCDNPDHRRVLMGPTPKVEAFARRTQYGDSPDVILPFGEAYPDKLVQPADYKEVIADCHTRQIFPFYHQRNTWAPAGFQWTQNGLGYCWTWGATAALMDLMAREGRDVPLLSPVSAGYLVDWKDRGNYLESAIGGLKKRGVCEMKYTPNMHSLNYKQYLDGWEANALQYRLAEAWDLDNNSNAIMIQHAISVLATGSPCYIAYNWWGHALECCAVEWDESVLYNVIWWIRNSHNENDIIKLSGSKGVFDESYSFRATLLAA